MDLSKLTDEQLQIALKVADEAKKQGINPDFVLPMVMQESGFKQDITSKRGALGVMQLMPDTAKGLGVDPTNMDENIRGGVSLLKELIANPKIGSDPYKVLAAYNTSTDTRNKFLDSGDLSTLPDETINHMVNVSNHYGGNLPSVSYQEPAYTVPSVPNQGAPLVPPNTTQAPPPQAFQIPEPIAAVAGGLGGASIGKAAAIGKAKIDAAHEAYDALHKKVFGTPTEVIPTGETPGGKWGAKTGYGVGEGTVEEASSKYKRMAPQGKVSSRLAKMYGVRKPGESPELLQRLIDRKNAEALAQTALPEATTTSKFGNYVKGLAGYPLKGAMFGATAGLGLADIYNRLANKDKEGAAAATVGTVSPLLSAFIGSGGVLPAVGMATPLYLGASDRLKYLEKHPEEYRLEENEYDPMGNRQR